MAQWRDAVGYEGLYLVSDTGEVKSLRGTGKGKHGKYAKTGKILRPGKRGNKGHKYLFVVLSDGKTVKQMAVHRLVAAAFLENPLDLPEVNHKDENTMNNSVENLEWCTRQYNAEYSKAKRVSQYTPDGEKVAEYRSITAAAKITGIGRTAINNNLAGWSDTAGGFIWKYETEE